MRPNNVLLALSVLSWAHAYKIEIDLVGDIAQAGDQISIANEDIEFNSAMTPKGSLRLGPFGCPGACPGRNICPTGDNTIQITSQGSPFWLYCDRYAIAYGDNYATSTEPSFEACVERCASSPWCFGASYKPATKECRRDSDVAYPKGENKEWQSALRIRASIATPIRCPNDNNTIIHTGYRSYKVYCSYYMNGADVAPAITRPTYESCAQECDKIAGCASLFYNGKNNKCFFKSIYAVPPASPVLKGDDTYALLVPEGVRTKPACCPAKSK